MLLYLIQLSLFNYFQWKKYGDVFDEFFFSIVSTLIIAVAAQDGFNFIGKAILESKFVRYAGKISYGMYLFHLFVPTLFLNIAKIFHLNISNKYELFVIYYFLTFMLASASWSIIEGPLLKLKEKFDY
jgi:peptidoglycan/LPS O-acetylase OafA/YrhL